MVTYYLTLIVPNSLPYRYEKRHVNFNSMVNEVDKFADTFYSNAYDFRRDGSAYYARLNQNSVPFQVAAFYEVFSRQI